MFAFRADTTTKPVAHQCRMPGSQCSSALVLRDRNATRLHAGIATTKTKKKPQVSGAVFLALLGAALFVLARRRLPFPP
jgi:hypothetical protein